MEEDSPNQLVGQLRGGLRGHSPGRGRWKVASTQTRVLGGEQNVDPATWAQSQDKSQHRPPSEGGWGPG